jgi:hypothetical protein
VVLSASSGGYVSTAWLDAREWGLLERFMRAVPLHRAAEAVRLAIYTAVVEVIIGRVDPAVVEEELSASQPPPNFSPQLGRRREVAVRLPAPAPVQRLKKFFKERGISASLGQIVAFSLAVALRVLTQRPVGLPPQARELLRMALLKASRAPRSEMRRALLNELAIRMPVVERLARELRLPLDKWWRAIMREVETAADPIAAVERYIRGEATPKIPADDEWRWLWGKVLEDSRGDPALLAKRIWLWREPLKRKAPPAYRGLVDYVCKLAESNPQSALDLIRALADGRKVEVRAVERGEEDFCARGLQWFEAMGHAVGRAYRDARDRGAELHEAVLAAGDLIERYAKWRRRADLSNCPEVAERLAPADMLAEAYREYREFQKFVGVDYGRRGSIEDDPHVLGGSDLLIRWRGLNQKLGEAAFQLLFHFSISKRGLYGEGEGPLDTGHRGDVRQDQGQNP